MKYKRNPSREGFEQSSQTIATLAWTREQVIARLEDAGRTIIAMPASGVWPAGMRSTMPEVLQNIWDSYGTEPAALRPGTPSARAITKMQETWDWLAMVDDVLPRRVVAMRMLVHPITDRYRHSWRDVGERLGISDKTAKATWERGIDKIWYGLISRAQKKAFATSAV